MGGVENPGRGSPRGVEERAHPVRAREVEARTASAGDFEGLGGEKRFGEVEKPEGFAPRVDELGRLGRKLESGCFDCSCKALGKRQCTARIPFGFAKRFVREDDLDSSGTDEKPRPRATAEVRGFVGEKGSASYRVPQTHERRVRGAVPEVRKKVGERTERFEVALAQEAANEHGESTERTERAGPIERPENEEGPHCSGLPFSTDVEVPEQSGRFARFDRTNRRPPKGNVALSVRANGRSLQTETEVCTTLPRPGDRMRLPALC